MPKYAVHLLPQSIQKEPSQVLRLLRYTLLSVEDFLTGTPTPFSECLPTSEPQLLHRESGASRGSDVSRCSSDILLRIRASPAPVFAMAVAKCTAGLRATMVGLLAAEDFSRSAQPPAGEEIERLQLVSTWVP